MRLDAGGGLEVGGEGERYLRILQLAGFVQAQPWSIRPLTTRSKVGLVLDSVHPWISRWTRDTISGAGKVRASRPLAKLTFNSSFPTGDGRGPAWTGRGLTAELRAGVFASFGPLHIQVDPVIFLAQNSAFVLASNGGSSTQGFRDARFPVNIDAPQRFGDRSYGRLDPGNSAIALDLPAVTVGVSSAAQSWGPAREYPLVLSGNSGGFPHGYLATRQPVNLYIARVHFRVIAGHLGQSAYSPLSGDSVSRWTSAGVLLFMPRGLDGLEFGLTRFIHGRTSSTFPSIQKAARLFSSGLRQSGALNEVQENQVASAFFRWYFPRADFEVYGEYFREDYSLGARRLIQYPDDLRSISIGAQRVIHKSAQRIRSLRFELVNGELPASNRGERGDLVERKLREPFPPYLHGRVLQGHTNRGLFLGSPEAYGGAGWRAGYDQFDRRGRTSFTVERALRLDWLPTAEADGNIVSPDVIFGVGAEAMRLVGAREMTLSLNTMVNLNRNLVRGHDVPNVRLAVSVRGFR